MKQRGRAVPPRTEPEPLWIPAATEDLPEPLLQAQIAEAVHQAICTNLRTTGADRCAYYAAVAANALPYITGQHYTINSGSMVVATRPDGYGFAFNARSPRMVDGEFHALLVRDHGNDRFELADFASRHWRAWATRLGARWEAPEPPRFVWCFADALENAWPLGVRFAADLALTQKHLAWIHGAGSPLIATLTGDVLRRLGRAPT